MENHIMYSLISLLHKRKLRIVLLIILLIFNLQQPIQASEHEEPKQVLILFSHPFGMPWQNSITHIIYDTFETNTDVKVKLHTEYPGISQTYDDDYIGYLIELYRHKYKDTKLDLILSIDGEVSSFLLNYGDNLFPNVTIVSIADENIAAQSRIKSNWISITPEKKIKENIDIAVRLQPGTRNIAIISGSSKTDKAIEKATRQISTEYSNYLEFIFLTDMPMEEIIEQVSNLPDNTIILYLLTLVDSTGKSFIPKEILYDITAASNAPVYVLRDTLIGSGVVGGYVINTEVEGKILTDIALRILEGEKIENIPVNKDLNKYIFNWPQMKRWNINVEDIPPGSIILDRENTFGDLYKTQIIITILVILIEAFLILILLIQQSRLKTIRKSLTESQRELENKVILRTNDLTNTNKKLENEIIDHKKAKDRVQALLEDKELILTEVHHRIKNNMTTLMSLLSLQSTNSNSEEASSVLDDAKSRIQSMMILYDKLYKGNNFQNISIKDYFTTLIKEIKDNFNNSELIEINTDIENIVLDSKIVFSLGIIFNELITNAMKYAFPNNMNGSIDVSVLSKDNNIQIIIGDNGIGLPKNIGIDSLEGFGLSLVKILTKQLSGTIKIENENGTKFILEIYN